MSDRAIYWLLRQRDGDMTGADWAAFADWLGEDDANRVAFDEALAADEALGQPGEETGDLIDFGEPLVKHDYVGDPPTPANDNSWVRYAGMIGALAAVLAVVAVFTLRGPADDPAYSTIATAPGEQRSFALTDQIEVNLNGGTRIAYSQDAATVRLLEGEALFTINGHEPEALRVEVADLVLVDVGTVFGVVLDEERVRMAVAEGAIIVNPQSGLIRLDAGQQAEKRLSDARIMRREVALSAVGGWAEGRLEFSETPARQVAADFERTTGIALALDERFADTSLTGTVQLGGADRQSVADLAALLGGTARRAGDGWRID